MNIPLQITLRDIEHSDALEACVREEAAKLERVRPRMTSCRVTINKGADHPQHGRQFGVHLEVRAPNHEDAVSTLKHHEDVYVALSGAFGAVRRQLEELAREARGRAKAKSVAASREAAIRPWR